MQKRHNALYGSIALAREFCNDCFTFSLIIKGVRQCCDKRVEQNEDNPDYRMSDVPNIRKGPSAAYKRKMLSEQDNKCFYCQREFGSIILKKRRLIRLQIHWDHWIPHDYSRNNRDKNFVAACHVCNAIKAARIFDTLEQARLFIYVRQQKKGYTDW